MAAMAVSDIDEGFQDAIYGKYGANIETHNYLCDHVFAGNKTAYMITELALGGLSWAGSKSLAGYAGEKIAAEGLDNTIDDSFNIVDRSIDETAADSEKMLEESGSRLALPEPEKLLELPPPEEQLRLSNGNELYHSANPKYVNTMIRDGFNINFPSKAEAFARNRFGRGVYLADSPATALGERPGGTILKIKADLGKNLYIVDRGVIGESDYTMTQAIARGARKHGYDSISFLSRAAQEKGFTGINTMVFDPNRLIIEEVLP